MAFASKNDLSDKKITIQQLTVDAYAYTAEGDPNSGFIVGDEAVMVIEAQATPLLAAQLINKIREITDKPIKYLVLTHYHAVRVLGASAFKSAEIISSVKTKEMIIERGSQDWKSEFERFPRLFQDHESIGGLTYPSIYFSDKMVIDLGNKIVKLLHLGEGHTRGDVVAWLPKEKVLYAGDLVEKNATPYCGDAQLKNWPITLQKLKTLKPNALVPGRGEALTTAESSLDAIDMTARFITILYNEAKKAVRDKLDLKTFYDNTMELMKPQFGHWHIFQHCMCFNISRAFDEASGINHPRIWTKDRDIEMWNQLNGLQ